jgi:hypothetical protein
MFMNWAQLQASKRKGKWGLEEEIYTNKIIQAFNEGTLAVQNSRVGGQLTLRAYLAEKLNCDPMRITKKFTGAACLGKRVYHKVGAPTRTQEEIDGVTRELEQLEKNFRGKVEEVARKKSDEMAVSTMNLLELRDSGIPIDEYSSAQSIASSSSAMIGATNSWMFQSQGAWNGVGTLDMDLHMEACKRAQSAYQDYVRMHGRKRSHPDGQDEGGSDSSSGADEKSANGERNGRKGSALSGAGKIGSDSGDSNSQVYSPNVDALNMIKRKKYKSNTSSDATLRRADSDSFEGESTEGGTSTEGRSKEPSSGSSGGGSSDSNNEEDSAEGNDSDGRDIDSNEEHHSMIDQAERQSLKRRKADSAAASALLGLGVKSES